MRDLTGHKITDRKSDFASNLRSRGASDAPDLHSPDQARTSA